MPNGSGEILWDKTINETFTLLCNNRPYYPEILTKRRVNDDHDFFKRLHEAVLTKCSKELGHAGLLELFDITGLDISDEEIEDFGDKDYILDRIVKELNIQFNTRKQLLLKTLYAYIAKNGTLDDLDCFSVYGTNSFNLIWEHVCSEILNNQLQKPIGSLSLPVPLQEPYRAIKGSRLIDLIERPQWRSTSPYGQEFIKEAKDTLIPDIITISQTDGVSQFIIYDAKYYNLQLDWSRPLRGYPGIESIVKQYMYQLAYQDFINVHQIDSVRNCFLLPTEECQIIDKGFATLPMLHNLQLQDIQIRFLPAELVFTHYLSNTKLKIKDLAL